MLKISNLSFHYTDQLLLHNISFIVHPGSLLYLRGNNGAGKTTLLKLIAGILCNYTGEIVFNQQLITQDLQYYQQNLCYIGHKLGFSPLLTIRENCKFFFNKSINFNTQQLEEHLEKFNLLKVADIPCGRLSAGQCKRLNLMRLVMSAAKLWLLDEPFTALDEQTLVLFTAVITEHLQQNGLIIFTSHQLIFWLPSEEYSL